jgi:hypothetical protein
VNHENQPIPPGTNAQIEDIAGRCRSKVKTPGAENSSGAMLRRLVTETGGKIVAWKKLKGVWNDKHYPIIWIDFPSRFPDGDSELVAQEFDPGQIAECSSCEEWESQRPGKEPLPDFANKLQNARERLPKSLGIVDPYIIGDPDGDDTIPDDHKQILDLLTQIKSHQPDVQKQDADEQPAGDGQEPRLSEAEYDELFQSEDDEQQSDD